FGDENIIGKATTSDCEENKSTLLISYALKHADAKQKAKLKKLYGKKGITKREHETIKQIFIETGALAYSEKKIKSLTAEAQKIIPQLTKDETKQKLLLELTNLLLKREK